MAIMMKKTICRMIAKIWTLIKTKMAPMAVKIEERKVITKRAAIAKHRLGARHKLGIDGEGAISRWLRRLNGPRCQRRGSRLILRAIRSFSALLKARLKKIASIKRQRLHRSPSMTLRASSLLTRLQVSRYLICIRLCKSTKSRWTKSTYRVYTLMQTLTFEQCMQTQVCLRWKVI